MESDEMELDVVVEYRLKEYLQVLLEFAPIEHHRRALLSGKAKSGRPKRLTWPVKVLLVAVGSVAFFYKVNKVGTCRFRIGPARIERASKAGTLSSPWTDVLRVLRLSDSYLVQKSNGAMPIPFRCMREEELAAFEHFVGSKLVRPVLGET